MLDLPCAPLASQETWAPLVRSFQDEGGLPSVSSFSNIVRENDNEACNSGISVMTLGQQNARDEEFQQGKNANVARVSGKRNDWLKNNGKTMTSQIIDEEGFQLVQSRKKNRLLIVEARRNVEATALKSATRKADIYLRNCGLHVTPEDVSDYILNEADINIDYCEPLNTRDPNYKNFKVGMNSKEREKLLSADLWQENIMCKKYFNFHKI